MLSGLSVGLTYGLLGEKAQSPLGSQTTLLKHTCKAGEVCVRTVVFTMQVNRSPLRKRRCEHKHKLSYSSLPTPLQLLAKAPPFAAQR